MLHAFIADNRNELIARARTKVASRSAPRPTEEELDNGIPLFIDQLVEALRMSTPRSETRRSSAAIGASAAIHGGHLLRMGFTIAQVVHDYGDVCQAVTELAVETGAPITTEEFHTLNRCLDDAIAEAVTEYTQLRETWQSNDETERLGALAHELRNKLSAALLAFATLKTGRVGVGGSTGGVLDRSLRGLGDLIDRALAEVRIDAGLQNRALISITELVEEIELDASLEADSRGFELTVTPVPRGLVIEADRAIVAAAVMNLLQNAFKFSHAHGRVTLTTSATAEHVLFEVEDECGGLPPGRAEELFRPFTQRSVNRRGLGLGLSICRHGIEASGGSVRVRDLPGKGCVFTVQVPRVTAS